MIVDVPHRNGPFYKFGCAALFFSALVLLPGNPLGAVGLRQRPLPPRQGSATSGSEDTAGLKKPADASKPQKKKISRAIFTHATVGGALHEREGRSLFLGGGLGWLTTFPVGVFFSPQVTGFGGPRERLDDGMVSGYGIISSLSFGYHFRSKRAAIGPAIGAGVKWHKLDFVFDDVDDISRSVISFRGSVSVDGHVFITEHLALAMRLDLGFLSNPEAFRKSSDNEIVLRTPWLEGALFAGFRFFL